MMVIDVFGDAADAVAAHLSFGAIQIVHSHAEICFIRRTDENKTVGTDAKMAVADNFGCIGRVFNRFIKTVYI